MGKTRDLFKKIRDTKGTFHAKMGTIKDRNGMDLTEAEDIKKRWKKYTEWNESGSVMSDYLQPHGLYSLWNSLGQNTGVGSLSLLQGIFPTQELNPGLPHCRQILYQLSHKGSPRILEWVDHSFSRDLPDPGIEWGFPVLQVDSLPTKISGKP